MTNPADGAQHPPIVDPALNAGRDDARDPALRDRETQPDTERDRTAAADGGGDVGRSPADRDEEERYAQDRNSPTPYSAQDNPDVISLDEQHDADAGRGAADRRDADRRGDSDSDRGGVASGEQTDRVSEPRRTAGGGLDAEHERVSEDTESLAADRDDLTEQGALGADARERRDHRDGADGELGSADALGQDASGRGTSAADGGDRVHILDEGDPGRAGSR